MLDRARQDIGNGLDAAMRMPREARQIVARIVITEIIHHQEWIGERGIAKAEDALKIDAGALNMG